MFLPESANDLANSLLSFACGIQVQSFRAIHGNSITTTMCIGNFRSGTSNLDRFLVTKEKSYLKKSLLYYGIIGSFILGAIIESFLIPIFGTYAIIFSSVLLLIALLIMFYEVAEENAWFGIKTRRQMLEEIKAYWYELKTEYEKSQKTFRCFHPRGFRMSKCRGPPFLCSKIKKTSKKRRIKGC